MQFASRPELSCFSSGCDQNCLVSSRETRHFRATVTIWQGNILPWWFWRRPDGERWKWYLDSYRDCFNRSFVLEINFWINVHTYRNNYMWYEKGFCVNKLLMFRSSVQYYGDTLMPRQRSLFKNRQCLQMKLLSRIFISTSNQVLPSAGLLQ